MSDLPRRDFLATAGAAVAGAAVLATTGAKAAAGTPVFKRYVIERDAPGVGNMTPDEVGAAAAASCAAIAQLAPNVQWEHSYRTADKFFCVYLSVDEDTIRKHAELAGIPVTKITPVTSIVDPTLAAS